MKKMEFKQLENMDELEEIYNESMDKVVIIFKHSTRCPTSTRASNEIQKVIPFPSEGVIIAQILVIENRDISDQVAKDLEIKHESPQIIIVKNRHPIYNTSHFDITKENIMAELDKLI